MSGNQDLPENAKERMSKVDRALDDYELSIGLSTYKAPGTEQELETYLNMNRDELEKLSPTDCMQISYRLCQYAFHIQRSYNREIARVNWANSNIKYCIASSLSNYDKYAKYEEKLVMAIKDNEYATKVNNILHYAQQRADRLTFLSNNINNLSNVLKELCKAKSNKNV